MWRLEAVPRLEAASRQIFTASVLDLVLGLNFSTLALALSQDQDQATNFRGKTQHNMR